MGWIRGSCWVELGTGFGGAVGEEWGLVEVVERTAGEGARGRGKGFVMR